ncbi:DUF6011 domain-containing protein [Streptomyces sparsogenes]|uniref:DUF6011 domain-containing protein n=1 Tax=Streptomyces sparsogenes TaxID=67365 RepID=UPI003408FEE1
MTPDDPAPLPGFDEPAAGRSRITCRMCGRPLRGSKARMWGLGEDCRGKLEMRSAPRPPEHEVEQETLPGS